MKQENIDDITSSLIGLEERYLPVLKVFIEFLKTSPQMEKPKGRPRDLLGAFKDKIHYVSPDFDEPMELVDSKRLRELEALEEAQIVVLPNMTEKFYSK